MKPTLVVMLKTPRPGRVKTRLGREIGMVRAAWWFRHQVRQLLRAVDDPRWDLVLAVSPDREGMTTRTWPARYDRWPQGSGDLGDRMVRMMRKARGPVCVIGADIPAVTRSHIHSAFAALGRADSVIGPAPDGGYWLIGAKLGSHLPPKVLVGVRWSTPHARVDTEAALAPRRIVHVAQLADVDTADDLR